MKYQPREYSWQAMLGFYLVLLVVIVILDWQHSALQLPYLTIQIGLTTIGMAILAFIGSRYPQLTARRGVFLVFSISILTIIPAVLMTIDPQSNFWTQYFGVGLGVAAGSFLGFLFMALFQREG